MRLRAVLFVSGLVTASLTSACDLESGPSTPTAASPTNPAGSFHPPADRPTPPPTGSPPASTNCDASKAQWAVGQPASDDLLERARIAAGASTARFLRPNQPITTEYFGWRLNLGLNEQDIVRGVNCG
jgi:hypothetical protein